MSTELVAILDRWKLNGPSARVNVKLGVLREAADELTALKAKVALLTEALATDRLAVIEECARAADAVAKEIKAKGWPQYAAQQCATAIRAISESDKEKP